MTARKFFSSPWRSFGFLVLTAATLLWLVPFIQAVLTSVRTNQDLIARGFFSLPNEISLDSFRVAWELGGLSRYLPNSFIITIPSLVFTLFLSSLSMNS